MKLDLRELGVKSVLIGTISLVLILDTLACSSLVLKNGSEVFLAKNFDWTYGNGYLIKNLRSTKKQAFYTQAGKPVSWISKYGSVTFNQNGKEMPYGGMNEKGLTVEMLWLEFTNYGETAQREFLNELEWIQFQLDNYASVEEVLANLQNVAINPIKGKIHYILADPTGMSVVIEFLNGAAVITNKQANECQAITNYPAGISQQNYTKQPVKLKGNNSSHLHRYNVLQRNIENKVFNKPALSVVDGFKALQDVAIEKGSFRTYWSLVYDLNQKVIHFKTSESNLIKHVSLQQLDFDNELLGLNINAALQGDLTDSLVGYTPVQNADLIRTSFEGLGLNLVDAIEWSDHQFNLTGKEFNSYTKQYGTMKMVFRSIDEPLGYLNFAIMDSEESLKNQKPIEGGANGFNVAAKEYTWMMYGVPQGQYAIAVVQDKNRNRKLDIDKKGNTVERYAFGNGRRVEAGSFPRFGECAVSIGVGMNEVVLEVK